MSGTKEAVLFGVKVENTGDTINSRYLYLSTVYDTKYEAQLKASSLGGTVVILNVEDAEDNTQ